MINLWVRSQDRNKLIECHGFYIAYRIGDSENAYINGLDVAGKAHVLGDYSIKRADEVLSELTLLCSSASRMSTAFSGDPLKGADPAFVRICGNGDRVQELHSLVYEMPKE